jgi:hypothetical protein
MFNLWHLLAQWISTWLSPEPEPTHPDQMSLQEWADLPPHHPFCP